MGILSYRRIGLSIFCIKHLLDIYIYFSGFDLLYDVERQYSIQAYGLNALYHSYSGWESFIRIRHCCFVWTETILDDWHKVRSQFQVW